MDQMPACPKCKGEYVYHDSVNFVCPDCGNEWNGNEAVEADEEQLIVKDSNGNLLADGDDVLLIKDLKLNGVNSNIKLKPYNNLARKTVVSFKNILINSSIGEYILEGDSELLNILYKTGIGSRRSEGFGMFEVIEELKSEEG